MAEKTTLPVNFQDDIISANMGGRRKYNLINNPDGTVSLEDVTEYTQVGSDYGAKQINATNEAVNACYSSKETEDRLGKKINTSEIVNSASSLLSATSISQVAGAVGIKGLKDYIPTNQISTYTGSLNNLGTGIFKCDLSKCSNYPSTFPVSTVTVLSYKNALQMIVTSANYDCMAYRRYDGKWGKWVVEDSDSGFNDAYKNGLLTNALSVDLNSPYGDANRTYYVDRARTHSNLPVSCQFGVREVSWLGKNWVVVRITGFDTKSISRQWVNTYSNNGGGYKWQGWSMLTQGMDRGNISRIMADSKVINKGSGGTSCAILTNSDINNLLGTTNSNNTNTLVICANGDGDADSTHYEGATYKGGIWYVLFNQTSTAIKIRVNYIIIYWGDGDKWSIGYGGKIG